jgi:hypothetical protein
MCHVREGVDGSQKVCQLPTATVGARHAAEVVEGRGGVDRPLEVGGEGPAVGEVSAVRVVVEVAELGFRVAEFPMAGGCKREVGGCSVPAVMAGRPAVEARRRKSTTGRSELDSRWVMTDGGGKTKVEWKATGSWRLGW